MNIDHIKDKLKVLQENPEKLKGIIIKKFYINPVISEGEINELETENKISFPEDYRDFVTKIGNGCIGPDYGILSLQESMIDFKLTTKPDIDLSKEFVYTNSWNESWISNIDWDNGDRPEEDQLEKYMNVEHIFGCLQICHMGHGCTFLLVVNGAEYGNIWIDERADYGGLNPLLTDDGSRIKFIEWYTEWLNEILPEE